MKVITATVVKAMVWSLQLEQVAPSLASYLKLSTYWQASLGTPSSGIFQNQVGFAGLKLEVAS